MKNIFLLFVASALALGTAGASDLFSLFFDEANDNKLAPKVKSSATNSSAKATKVFVGRRQDANETKMPATRKIYVEKPVVAEKPTVSEKPAVSKAEENTAIVSRPVTRVVTNIVERVVVDENREKLLRERELKVEKATKLLMQERDRLRSQANAKPAERIVEKQVVVEKPVEKIVEKQVIVEKPVEKVVEKQVIVEKPVEKVVEKQVVVEKPVEKIVEKRVIVEKPVEVIKEVTNTVERVVERTVTNVVERIVVDKSRESELLEREQKLEAATSLLKQERKQLKDDQQKLEAKSGLLDIKNDELVLQNDELKKQLDSERDRRARLERVVPKAQRQFTDKKTKISSASTFYDRKEGYAVFTGRVHVNDPEYQLHAQKAFVFMDSTNSLKRLVAIGNVAITNDAKRAYGVKASYYKSTGMIVLYGDANTPAQVRDESKVEDQVVIGDKIKFWTGSEQVEVIKSRISAPSGGASGANMLNLNR